MAETGKKFVEVSAKVVGRALCAAAGLGFILHGAFISAKVEYCVIGGLCLLAGVMPTRKKSL